MKYIKTKFEEFVNEVKLTPKEESISKLIDHLEDQFGGRLSLKQVEEIYDWILKAPTLEFAYCIMGLVFKNTNDLYDAKVYLRKADGYKELFDEFEKKFKEVFSKKI